jgi:hypothetical protein
MSVPQGWFPDPTNPTQLRWWDGERWSDDVIDPRAISPPSSTSAQDVLAVNADASGKEAEALRHELAQLRAQVIETRDVMLLQEVGIYQYSHPLESAAAYRGRLDELELSMKTLVKEGKAVSGTKKWVINGSEKHGAKMVSDLSKLMLRAYNSEADALVRSLRPYALKAGVDRLERTRETIAKLGLSMKIEISAEYHVLRVEELQLTSDYLAKLADEREKEKEERARLKEEEAAKREYEREQEKLEKERSHYETALRALEMKGDAAAVEETQAKLGEIQSAIEGVAQRAANIRAGYVYVISNVGAFGERVVKIGMTRRLDPLDRVRELGDASVPFRFDVHAIIFSADAVGIETALHRRFEHMRVNMVNANREFFFVKPTDVEDALRELDANILTFVEYAEALEWHQSENLRRSRAVVLPAATGA